MKPKVEQDSGMGVLHTQEEFGNCLTCGVCRRDPGQPETPRSPSLKPRPHDSRPLTEPFYDPACGPRPLALGSALTPSAIRPPAEVRFSDLHGDFRLAARGGRRGDAARGRRSPLDRRILPRSGLAFPRDP